MKRLTITIRPDEEYWLFEADIPHEANLTGERVRVSARTRIALIRAVRKLLDKSWRLEIEGNKMEAVKE